MLFIKPGKGMRLACLVFLLSAWACGAAHAAGSALSLGQRLAELEQSSGGRLGVALIDADGGGVIGYRENERFAFCSTFKAILVAAVLKHSEADGELLQKVIRYGEKDLVSWSPVTEKHAASGMTVSALCAAAIQYSDNGAANLLLRELGGPEALTAFARSLGDTVFSLDRWEPELNSAEPGDARDTSSPLAMAKTLGGLVFGDALEARRQEQLLNWLIGNTTGNESIRAGIPEGWLVGDKTGSGGYGTTNDLAVIWPPLGPPRVLAVYYTQDQKDAPSRREVLAAVARLVAAEILEAYPRP